MISAVVDTNILVRGTIASHPGSASKGIVDAFFAGRFVLFLSLETLLEIHEVLFDKNVRAKHGWSDEKIADFCRALEVGSQIIEPKTVVSAALTRDVSDTKWVALALDAKADYLVTKDWRHLERLRKVGQTKIVRPRAFLSILK
jgi:putative PIN family toxin of toxin-antitoxin system